VLFNVIFTFPVDWFSKLSGFWVVDDVGDDVFGLSEVVLADSGESGESEG
jgi:hypothetical protein